MRISMLFQYPSYLKCFVTPEDGRKLVSMNNWLSDRSLMRRLYRCRCSDFPETQRQKHSAPRTKAVHKLDNVIPTGISRLN